MEVFIDQDDCRWATCQSSSYRWNMSWTLLCREVWSMASWGEIVILSPVCRPIHCIARFPIDRFYQGMETFVKQLNERQSPTPAFQFNAITMQDIWIYVYIFAGGQCLACVVFICECLVFYRHRLLKVLEYFRPKSNWFRGCLWLWISNLISTWCCYCCQINLM